MSLHRRSFYELPFFTKQNLSLFKLLFWLPQASKSFRSNWPGRRCKPCKRSSLMFWLRTATESKVAFWKLLFDWFVHQKDWILLLFVFGGVLSWSKVYIELNTSDSCFRDFKIWTLKLKNSKIPMFRNHPALISVDGAINFQTMVHWDFRQSEIALCNSSTLSQSIDTPLS